MIDYVVQHYQWFKAFHLVAVMSWMAGMLYLPRLYVYHTTADKGSELSETLKIMERKLLRGIINPAMIVAFLLGLSMIVADPAILTSGGWMHVKLTAALGLFIFHAFLSRWRKAFLYDRNTHSERFFRIVNEVPAVLMIVIVIMAIVKPF